MPPRRTKDIEKLLGDDAVMTAALAKGVRAALLRHKQAGNPIVVWRDGKVVWVPPEEIVIDGEMAGRRPSTQARRGKRITR